jgi:hypothetical protein
MIHWMHTLISHGGTHHAGGRYAGVPSVDSSCVVCDHPFGNLTHACISALGPVAPTGVVEPLAPAGVVEPVLSEVA